MFQQLAVQGIIDRQGELSHTQQQLSSGQRILTTADDPSGTTQLMRLQQNAGINKQYQRNIDYSQSRLEFEEGVLTSVTDTLQRVRVLAVQGLNATQGAENRKAIATEMYQRLDELMGLANTKDGSGEYLFAGYNGQTKPFVDAGGGVFNYQGDQGQRQIQISPLRQISSSDNGYDLFVNLPSSAGGTQDMFKTVYDLAASLDANAPVGTSLQDIDAALDKIVQVRAGIGARINAVEAQRQIGEQFQVQVEGAMSQIGDLDYAEAIGRLNQQLVGMQAAQQSFQKVQNLSLFNYL
jgi:flagellar hook-associated protein 3 FlgL